MELDCKQALARMRMKILDDLEPEYILDYLLSKEIISPDQYESIKTERGRKTRVTSLLNMLPHCGPEAFQVFIESLNYENQYTWLADNLETERAKITHNSDGQNSTLDFYSFLIRGGVPCPPMNYVEREEEIEAVRSKLTDKCVQGCWLVLHGMSGCGKSTIAAEALRDANLIAKHFAGGVFWVPCGNVEDDGTLVMKMQALCEKLDDSFRQYQANDVHTAMERLRELLTREKYRKSVIVLDKVWSDRVISAFDIGCCVMVVTRDVGIMKRARGRVFKTQISSGFSLSQSLILLANFLEIKKENLPVTAEKIHAECKGVPMMMAMIGGYLSDFRHNHEAWDDYLRKMRRRRRPSNNDVETDDKTRLDINQAICDSIDPLSDDLKQFYNSFAIFLTDVWIPSEVLATYWKMNSSQVNDIMIQLVKKSLAYRFWDENTKQYSYMLHSLQLAYLKEKNIYQEKDMHKDLINSYGLKCGRNWKNLPQDDYIFWYIGYHLHRATLSDLMNNIYLDLGFVIAKVKVTKTGDILYDFNRYSKEITGNNPEAKHQFQSFIRTNAHLMEEDQYDMLQLALCQPQTSAVYDQAIQIVARSAGKSTMYLDWCTKDLEKSACKGCTKNHTGPVYTAVFTPSGKSIISCGKDCTIRVWDCLAGRQILHILGHDHSIISCSLSENGTKFATCSSNHIVKVWDLNIDVFEKENMYSGTDSNGESPPTPFYLDQQSNLSPCVDKTFDLQDFYITTFKEANHLAVCCSLTPDGRKMVSGGGEGIAKVWSTDSGNLLTALKGHSGPIRCCQFSPDGNLIATGSDDATLRIWDHTSYLLKRELEGEDGCPIVSCCFYRRSSKIAAAIKEAVIIWDVESGHREAMLSDPTQFGINSVSVSSDGQYLAAGTAGSSIAMWSLDKEKVINFHKGHKGWVYSVSFSQSGDRLLSTSEDGTVMIWDTECDFPAEAKYRRSFNARFHGKQVTVALMDRSNTIEIMSNCIKLHSVDSDDTKEIVSCCVLSNNADLVAIGCCVTGLMKLMTLKPPTELIERYQLRAGTISCCEFSADDSMLVTGSDNFYVGFVYRNKPITYYDKLAHTEPVVRVKLFDGDHKLLSCSNDKSVMVWDVVKREVLWTYVGHTNSVVACDISPDDRLVASASTDCTARMWEVSDAVPTQVYQHNTCVRSCRFAPNCQLFVTGDDNGVIRVWNLLRSTHEPAVLLKCDSWVRDLAISSDSRYLMSASNNLKWWDIETGSCLQTFHIQGNVICRAQASTDFQMFAAIDDAGVFYLLKTIRKPSISG